MLEIYDFKLIKSGRDIEVYDYRTKKILKGYHRKKRISQDKENKLTRQEWEDIVEEWGCDEEKEKLALVEAFRITIKNALFLLGIEVMDEM